MIMIIYEHIIIHYDTKIILSYNNSSNNNKNIIYDHIIIINDHLIIILS